MTDEERAWAAMACIFNLCPETPKACRDWCVTVLQQEAKAVRAEEREACADAIHQRVTMNNRRNEYKLADEALECERTIRARGEG